MLSNDDRRFIVQSVENGYKVSDLAKMFNVTPRRVQQIIKENMDGTKQDKRDVKITESIAKEIEDLWNTYKIGSRTIYYLLKSRDRSVSYYQIYNYMRNRKMIRTKAPKSQISYEEDREPPLATVYMDYHQSSMEHPYAVVCMDMTSKKILSLAESRKITKELMEASINNISLQAEKTNLSVNRLFLRNGVLSILYGATDLRYSVQRKGIENVETDKHGNRVHLSLSKFWQNYDKFRWSFSNIDNFIFWYNNRPVTRSENRVTTPNEIVESYVVNQQVYASTNTD